MAWRVKAVAIGAVMAAMAADAQAQDRVRRFDIACPSMTEALISFGREARVQVLFAPTEVAAARPRPVEGLYDPQSALRRLLDASGLIAVWAGDDRVIVRHHP